MELHLQRTGEVLLGWSRLKGFFFFFFLLPTLSRIKLFHAKYLERQLFCLMVGMKNSTLNK